MLSDNYKKLKFERDSIKEDMIHFLGEPSRPLIERLLTLTRVLDRAAGEWAREGDRDVMSFLPDGREIDYQNGDDD